LKAWNGVYEGDAKNGFDGTNYATDKELLKALKEGSYNGGWIIPPRELLSGNLLAAFKNGVLKGIKTAVSSGSDYPVWYWSSTEGRDYPSNVWFVRFSDGREDWNHKDTLRLSCRPVRLVVAPGS
jgi:hypothetical protein